jgi:transmembrane sensor
MERSTNSARPWSEEAAHWWTVLHGDGATSEDRREFLSWVSRSPDRIEAYLRIERLTSVLSSGQVYWPDTPAEILIREARASGETVPVASIADLTATRAAERSGGAMRDRPRIHLRWKYSLAAAVPALAAVLVACWLLVPAAAQRYATAPGEQRSILLADGSRVTLDSASSMAVDFRKHHRIVRLLEGEALFQVTHDPAKPFDVYADGAVVRAIGTEFNVDLLPSYADLTVLQGRVAVMSESQAAIPVSTATTVAGSAPPHEHSSLVRFPAPIGALILSAAQHVLITRAGLSFPKPVSDPSATTAWMRRQLVFEQRPLGEVVDELDRETGRRIVIDSSVLRARRVTGVMQLDDPQSLLEFLSDVPGVVIRKMSGGTSVVTLQRDAAAGISAQPAGHTP